jgi:hypothetical protein
MLCVQLSAPYERQLRPERLRGHPLAPPNTHRVVAAHPGGGARPRPRPAEAYRFLMPSADVLLTNY